MKTVAAVSRQAKEPFSIEEIELPEPVGNEVLVQIRGVGICHTDLASRDGTLGAPFPAVFGHEGAGVVLRVGPAVTKLKKGDHVVLAPASDGTCKHCQSGQPMYCEHFTDLNFQTDPAERAAKLSDGTSAALRYFGQSSFAHYALASERNTVKVRNDVPLEILGPLGCGIQTGAGTVMNGLRPEPGSSIAILGGGAVGLAAVLGAVVSGCGTIAVVDRVASRLELARELGATNPINTSVTPDLGTELIAAAPGGFDYIVDCAGNAGLMTASLLALGKLGVLALVAVPPAVDRKLELPWFPTLLQGQSVRGFVEGNSIPDIFIPRMIDLFAQGRFPFDKLVTKYRFDQINEAVAHQLSGKTIKAVLQVER
ncbi:NAD(P)-dependent alcohol dehydrogenase [Rhizobium mesosinicum]|uniref:NAD(P)-dependent alcohol dehydrogenase n=1 Tax=Rhizobium mesosinicum TaxID=335017 RepID=A0ABS7GM52_9HYPH|nr:NAD(P)-dependent alcohol dehydrogenase [Rhizobium mesosinicum]